MSEPITHPFKKRDRYPFFPWLCADCHRPPSEHPQPQAEPLSAICTLAFPQRVEGHRLECNYHYTPIGGPGCICDPSKYAQPQAPEPDDAEQVAREWLRPASVRITRTHEETVASLAALIRESVRKARQAGREDGKADAIRAYHVTLDALGAPSDEWPCNRAKAAIEQRDAVIAELRRKLALAGVEVARFPIQAQRGAAPHPLSIPWEIAELAYSVYLGDHYGSGTLERMAERGGFGPGEMDMFLPGWRDMVSGFTERDARIKELEEDYARVLNTKGDLADDNQHNYRNFRAAEAQVKDLEQKVQHYAESLTAATRHGSALEQELSERKAKVAALEKTLALQDAALGVWKSAFPGETATKLSGRAILLAEIMKLEAHVAALEKSWAREHEAVFARETTIRNMVAEAAALTEERDRPREALLTLLHEMQLVFLEHGCYCDPFEGSNAIHHPACAHHRAMEKASVALAAPPIHAPFCSSRLVKDGARQLGRSVEGGPCDCTAAPPTASPEPHDRKCSMCGGGHVPGDRCVTTPTAAERWATAPRHEQYPEPTASPEGGDATAGDDLQAAPQHRTIDVPPQGVAGPGAVLANEGRCPACGEWVEDIGKCGCTSLEGGK